jgi:uracil-DNA glycosylase family 4
VARLTPLEQLQSEIVACARCGRLRDHCSRIAAVKRRAYSAETYWGKPVPSFGDPNARLLILGLAPAAHGANRTGRMFTGDRSGDFLYRAMHETGFASQPTSRSPDDGLSLHDAYITASAHCAPPDNKPAPDEIAACRSFLIRELGLLQHVQVVLALGRIAFDNYLNVLRHNGTISSRSPFLFGHNVLHSFDNAVPALLCSYHPSQQNTSTGKLTHEMLVQVFLQARSLLR